MATLREYFIKDGAKNLTTHQAWEIKNQQTDEKYGEVIARLHLDFDAHAKYISFFVPDMPGVELAEAFALNNISQLLDIPEKKLGFQAGFGGEQKDAKDLVFTGQIYLYSERPVPEADKTRITAEATKAGHNITFRSISEALSIWRSGTNGRSRLRLSPMTAVTRQRLLNRLRSNLCSSCVPYGMMNSH